MSSIYVIASRIQYNHYHKMLSFCDSLTDIVYGSRKKTKILELIYEELILTDMTHVSPHIHCFPVSLQQ